MVNKFVIVNNLSSIFNASTAVGNQQGYDVSKLIDGVVGANNDSIIFIKDSTKGKFIWAKGELYNCNNNIYSVLNGKLSLETLKADESTKGDSSNSTIYVQTGTGFSANTNSNLTYKVVYTGNSDSDDWGSIGS